jgi:predicted transcriptional regulator
MNLETFVKLEAKAGLKQLRQIRKDTIAASAAKMKEQKKVIKAIKAQLQQPKTVPEIAEATGIPSSTVLWYVSALKKYGEVKETEKDGGYFRYCSSETL